MTKINYQHILNNKLEEIIKTDTRPKLLLHSCCAPCSSYVLEYLSKYFEISVFYYNPNIHPKEEFDFRAKEQEDLINKMSINKGINFLLGNFNSDKFYKAIEGLESEKEGGVRCEKCFRLRLEESAIVAKTENFDYFTTTLSISPMKNADLINDIGRELSLKYNISYLYSDFKKNNGYLRSIELSKEYNLYRQNYCGCIYSKNKTV